MPRWVTQRDTADEPSKQRALAFLDRGDVRVSIGALAFLFLGLVAMPKAAFWYWFTPLAVAYVGTQWALMRSERRIIGK